MLTKTGETQMLTDKQKQHLEERKDQMMKLNITRKIGISHFVASTDKDSPCQNWHGHTLKVEVTLYKSIQDDGMTIDFKKVKSIIDEYDHQLLISTSDFINENLDNQTITFKFEDRDITIGSHNISLIPGISPTCELLARELERRIIELIGNDDVIIKISESENSYIET